MVGSPTAGEDPPKVLFGLDGLHTNLDSQPLAALGTTTREHGTPSLSGHTGAETVGLGALALVGLVCTLHNLSLLG